LNNFPAGEEHTKLMSIMFQNLFPPLNVQLVKVNQCRRVVLFNFLKEERRIEFRHYAIKVSPVGINKNVKKIIKAKIPDLSNLDDISDFILG
jgi:ribosome biogenesis protein SSF1/2